MERRADSRYTLSLARANGYAIVFQRVNRVTLHHIALRDNRFSNWVHKVYRVFFGFFLLQFVLVWARLWLPWPIFPTARWPEGLLLVLTAATLMASLARQLPGQNVMLASVIIALTGGAAQTLGAMTGIPFGPYVYTEHFGQRLFNPLPWPVPLLWIVLVLASRGVARLVLRPWRQTHNYGFRLIGLSTLLVVLQDLGLEPFATGVKDYWFWRPTRLGFDWYGAPCVNFLGWAVTALLILAFVTPCLINKKPGQPPPPDYSPLAVWLLISFLFATGAAVHQLWPAVGLVCVTAVTVTVFGIGGARWRAGHENG